VVSSDIVGDAHADYLVANQPVHPHSTLAREELGYDPQYDIDRAIPAYVRWLRNREYV
jgi:nucleoside-diphosphate-sugar epimerase